MVLEGTYKIEKEANTLEYFKAVGLPEKFAEHVLKIHTYVTIESKDNEYSFTLAEEKDKPHEIKIYQVGKEFDEPAGQGVMKSTFIEESGNLVLNSVGEDGTKYSRKMEPTPNGIVHIFSHDKTPIVCKRFMVKL